MNTVKTWQDIEDNINRLESYRHSLNSDEVDFYKGLIRRGICFVVTKRNGEFVFGPSRFVGYRDNDMNSHKASKTKDGRVTNPAISDIVHAEPTQDGNLEAEYKKFCVKLGIQPGERGQFGVRRRYWMK